MALGPRIEGMKQELYRIDRLLESPPVDEAAIDASLSDMKRSLVELAPPLELVGEELKGLARGWVKNSRPAPTASRWSTSSRESWRRSTPPWRTRPPLRGKAPARPAQKLQDYIKADPDSARARAFREVLKERPLWDSLAAWNRIASGWRPVPQGLAPPIAKARAAECARVPRATPRLPQRRRG